MNRTLRLPGGAAAGAVTADQARKLSIAGKFGTATFMSPSRVAAINRNLTDNAATVEAWAALQAAYDTSRVPTGPADGFAWAASNNGAPASGVWEVPSTYQVDTKTENGVIISALRYDAIAAYGFALQYRLTGDEAYAVAAVAQMQPWTAVIGFINDSGDNTRLGWANNFPMMLAACSMLTGSPAYTASFDAAMRALALVTVNGSAPVPVGTPPVMTQLWPNTPASIGYGPTNNQGAWGVYLNLAVAAFLADRAMFDKAVARWKQLLDYSIDDNSDLWQELYRQEGKSGDGSSGLHYCVHALNAFALGAEVARANGVWLFDYVTTPQNLTTTTTTTFDPANPVTYTFHIHGGKTLRDAWARVMPWLADPDTYPYNSSGATPVGEEVAGTNVGPVEFLHAEWPIDASLLVLTADRPVVDKRIPYTTLTHAGTELRG